MRWALAGAVLIGCSETTDLGDQPEREASTAQELADLRFTWLVEVDPMEKVQGFRERAHLRHYSGPHEPRGAVEFNLRGRDVSFHLHVPLGGHPWGGDVFSLGGEVYFAIGRLGGPVFTARSGSMTLRVENDVLVGAVSDARMVAVASNVDAVEHFEAEGHFEVGLEVECWAPCAEIKQATRPGQQLPLCAAPDEFVEDDFSVTSFCRSVEDAHANVP